MPKFKVTQKYAIWITEVHEIEINTPEEWDILNEDGPMEFTSGETLIEKTEGDCVEGTWDDGKLEEIGVLDQILEAVDADPE